jgi:hypothetical protein
VDDRSAVSAANLNLDEPVEAIVTVSVIKPLQIWRNCLKLKSMIPVLYPASVGDSSSDPKK